MNHYSSECVSVDLKDSTILPATVHDNSHQVVHAVWVGGVPGRVEETEFQGEDDAVGQFGVAVELVHVFKALQVEGEDHG